MLFFKELLTIFQEDKFKNGTKKQRKINKDTFENRPCSSLHSSEEGGFNLDYSLDSQECLGEYNNLDSLLDNCHLSDEEMSEEIRQMEQMLNDNWANTEVTTSSLVPITTPMIKVVPVREFPKMTSREFPGISRFFGKTREGNGKKHIEIFAPKLQRHF